MPNPTEPHAPRVALLTLAAGLLLPGALAAQPVDAVSIPSSVSIPSLADVRSGHLAAPAPSRSARPDGPSTVVPALRVPGGAAGGPVGPPRGLGDRPLEPPSVLEAVLALAGPRDAGAEDARESLGSLGDVLPRELCRDLLELRARVQRYRTVLFGDRGILRWGRLEGPGGRSRLRLNLQADPDPGFRVTLVTR